MLWTGWFLLIVFGFLGCNLFFRYVFKRINKAEAVLMVVSLLIVGFAGGFIWGTW